MQVKIKKLHPDAVIPKYETAGSAGMDLTAVSKKIDQDGNICYDTGLAFEIPAGFVGYIYPRSSLSKKDLMLANHVGVIDSDYRGSVSFKFKPTNAFSFYTERVIQTETAYEYEIGDRIGQIIIMPYPKIEFVEVDELEETERGNGGFGSSGK